MPELPEVESVRRSLEPHLLGATIRGVWTLRRDIITGPPLGFDLLYDGVIASIERRGKNLAIRTSDGRAICVHLGMSGQLYWVPGPGASVHGLPREDHVHLVWRIEPAGAAHDDPRIGRMVFRDPRRFGGVWTFRNGRDIEEKHWAGLGPDALAITTEHLINACATTKRAIKAVLLDQSILAGVGNIYADEAFFLAKVNPARRADKLTHEEITRLAEQIPRVLSAAIDAGGSTLRDFVNGNGDAGSYATAHAVYGRGGQPCLVCGRALSSAVLGQRTTVWCPSCQPRSPGRARRSSS